MLESATADTDVVMYDNDDDYKIGRRQGTGGRHHEPCVQGQCHQFGSSKVVIAWMPPMTFQELQLGMFGFTYGGRNRLVCHRVFSHDKAASSYQKKTCCPDLP